MMFGSLQNICDPNRHKSMNRPPNKPTTFTPCILKTIPFVAYTAFVPRMARPIGKAPSFRFFSVQYVTTDSLGMAKRSWFGLVKRFFTLDIQSNRKKKKRWLFGNQKVKRLTSISAPPVTTESIPCRTVEEQNSLVATNLVIIPDTDQNEEITEEVSHVKDQLVAPKICGHCVWETREAAAIKIQTAFRGYLARTALRALKGVVRLQAIIRGRAVRRQAIATLKRLQSVVNIQSQVCARRIQTVEVVNIQSQVCARRIQTVEETLHSKQSKQLLDFQGKDIKIDVNSQRRWDDSILTKEEETASFTSKREAAMKRERIKEYTFKHRHSTETDQNKVNEKWRYWLEQWVDTQLAKQEDLQNPDTSREDLKGRKLRNQNFNGLDSPAYFPRRSYHRKQHSIGDHEDSSFAGSPVFPTYMAATASAKAKVRSMSSPRLRPISIDTCSDTASPYKHKLLSPMSSINSEATSISRIANIRCGSFSQRSPSLTGVQGPVTSKKKIKGSDL